MFKIKFLFFAKVRELVKTTSQDIEIPQKYLTNICHKNVDSIKHIEKIIIKVSDLYEIVGQANQSISLELEQILKSCLFAINDDYIQMDLDSEIEIKQGDIISIIPPISAG